MLNNISLKFIKPKKLSFNNSKIYPKNNEVVIEVKSCGICGSDLKIYNKGSKRVKKNRIMGHEISGKILSSPKSQNFFPKDFNIALGADIDNKRDFALGHEIDGGFQKYLKINYKLLRKIPHYITKKKVDYDTFAITEPLACCLNGLEQMDFKSNKNVLIYGSGSIGQLIAKLSVLYRSKKIFLIDTDLFKLNHGTKDSKIKKLKLNNYKKKIQKMLISEKIDYIFVACSSKKAQKEALEVADYGAKINFFAGLPKKDSLDKKIQIDTNLIHYKQLKVVGSHGSRSKHIRLAAKLISERKIYIKDLITHRIKLKDYKVAFKKMSSNKFIKMIFNFN